MSDLPDKDHSRVVNHTLAPPVGTFQLDRVHTFVAFRAQHLAVGRVRGRFEDVTGTIVVAEDLTQSTVEVEIATASVTTLNSDRDADIRSEHYLDVARCPTITFRSTRAAESTSGTWLVTGDFTLHGVTNPVQLPVAFGGPTADAYGINRVAFHTEPSITRKDYGLTFELLKEAGTPLAGRDTAIQIDPQAIRSQ
ncbi:polyisoprenoid-binding protein [Microbacterium sp. SYP-A9085]|uniref:YceI family protein n=1 Tax=Microbacterium sp. SYP-A9085 TaxID=2664454 RepID=UPI00129BC774|nr:YceI family protein [Microbacterium sp. SYP-A9085]MRH30138.1 polyisoprenoid-binding protein [Microbacterium sp. SYP-A9085]